MARNDGGPAFPFVENDVTESGHKVEYITRGMSLRDYFAGQALATWGLESDRDNKELDTSDHIASQCYKMADAMLKAREAS